MNNIFIPNDPLLYGSQNSSYEPLYEHKLLRDREMLDKQYNEYMNSLKRPRREDKMAQLNASIKAMGEDVRCRLSESDEFVRLNTELQEIVQHALIETVKDTLNGDQAVIDNVDKQIKMIDEASASIKEADRKSMSEINDYLKNYSNMTFDDYKKLKSSEK